MHDRTGNLWGTVSAISIFAKQYVFRSDARHSKLHLGSTLNAILLYCNYNIIVILHLWMLHGVYRFRSTGVFYFTLGNILPKNRSSLKAIYLLAVAKSSVVREYGFGRILQPFITDMNHLTVSIFVCAYLLLIPLT